VKTRSKKERDDGTFIQPLLAAAAAFTIIIIIYPTSNQPTFNQSSNDHCGRRL
jgi:hypothetical protein